MIEVMAFSVFVGVVTGVDACIPILFYLSQVRRRRRNDIALRQNGPAEIALYPM